MAQPIISDVPRGLAPARAPGERPELAIGLPWARAQDVTDLTDVLSDLIEDGEFDVSDTGEPMLTATGADQNMVAVMSIFQRDDPAARAAAAILGGPWRHPCQ